MAGVGSAVTVNGGSFSSDIAQGATTAGSTEDGDGGYGGAIYNSSATLLIDDGATFTADSAQGGGYGTSNSYGGYGGEGGAIYTSAGQLLLSSATFSGRCRTARSRTTRWAPAVTADRSRGEMAGRSPPTRVAS